MQNYRHLDAVFKTQGHGLWIGDLCSAEDVEQLKVNNIKTVITCIGYNRVKYGQDMRHFVFDLKDIKTENVLQHFNKSSRYIKESLKRGDVLVHCGAGVSRSATLVIAYLIKEQNMPFQEALRLCKSKRPDVCPNLGFEMQLKFYQRSVRGVTHQEGNKQLLVKQRLNSLKRVKMQTLYPHKRTHSLIGDSRKSNSLQSKINFRLTLREFKG